MDAATLTKQGLISQQSKAILIPSISLIVLVFLFVFVLKTGISKISSQKASLALLTNDENLLKSKESLLKQIDQEILSGADAVLRAIPDKNPALSAVSQIRELALEKSLTILNLKASSPAAASDSQDLNKVEIAFDIEGGFSSILDFTKSISSLSPLITLQQINMTQAEGASRASISIRTYWAKLPDRLPSLNEPIGSLTTEDQAQLSDILLLRSPVFLEVAPEAPTSREDPFN